MDALTALADEYYDVAMSDSPLSLMWLGKLTHLDQWDDVTPVGSAQRVERYRAIVERAQDIEPVTAMDRALRDNILTGAQAAIARESFHPYLTHLNPAMGMFEMILSFIDNFPLSTADHGTMYVNKLRRLPDALAQLMDVSERGADDGIVPLARHLDATAASVEAYLATAAGSDDRLCAQAPPRDLDSAAQAQWREERDHVVVTVVRPELEVFAHRLRALANRGMPDDKPGLVHLPGGEDGYRTLMWTYLLLDKDPGEVHQMGLEQVERLEREYQALGAEVLGTSDVARIYATLRDDESMKYADPEILVADAVRALDKATAAMHEWFGTVPVSPCEVEATQYGPMAYYSTPEPAEGKPGKFYLNASRPQAWSTYEIEAIVFHEGIPGHHLHLALGAENGAVHPVLKELHNTAFAEGWGLYAERLADEMGLYESSLTRLGMLSADSLRACRLVVDTGIHALGWSRDQAIQYVLDHSPMDVGHITAEVDRYIGLPGQALSYMLGRLELEDIRREAERQPDFDIREFHDRLLGFGHVPLSTARAQALQPHEGTAS